jgi:hypothetical protein
MANPSELSAMMRVEHLDRYCIRDNGWEEYGLSQLQPSWEQIEAAIRALDRYCYVSVWLRMEVDEQGRARRRLDVMGGKGKYAIECLPGRRLCYRDESKPNGAEKVRIWESNQGAYYEESYLCDDIDLVLRIAWIFATQGRPHPRVPWEEQ